ncbi:hypothetical protein KIW84_054137 [Lathyrus oleraceus]|uniref:Uncharacterized protein n=1 Tax=Pisum sativum TaxID=3888 RepID=A0A9D4WSA8_PEA|nr:hypothetical protein KIW84_054137 [Pisum sativum]
MRPKGQVAILLILHNIKTWGHTSTISLKTSYLLYYIMKGKQVVVAWVIASELKMVDESGHREGMGPNCPLVFLGLIIGLIRANRINDVYISREATASRADNEGEDDEETEDEGSETISNEESVSEETSEEGHDDDMTDD